MELLKVQNLNAFYDNSQVLFNMNLNIKENNIRLKEPSQDYPMHVNFI